MDEMQYIIDSLKRQIGDAAAQIAIWEARARRAETKLNVIDRAEQDEPQDAES